MNVQTAGWVGPQPIPVLLVSGSWLPGTVYCSSMTAKVMWSAFLLISNVGWFSLNQQRFSQPLSPAGPCLCCYRKVRQVITVIIIIWVMFIPIVSIGTRIGTRPQRWPERGSALTELNVYQEKKAHIQKPITDCARDTIVRTWTEMSQSTEERAINFTEARGCHGRLPRQRTILSVWCLGTWSRLAQAKKGGERLFRKGWEEDADIPKSGRELQLFPVMAAVDTEEGALGAQPEGKGAPCQSGSVTARLSMSPCSTYLRSLRCLIFFLYFLLVVTMAF